MAAIVSSWLPKVCRLAGTVLASLGIPGGQFWLADRREPIWCRSDFLEPLLGIGLAGIGLVSFGRPGTTLGLGDHFGVIWNLLDSVLGFGPNGDRFGGTWSLLRPRLGLGPAGATLVQFETSWQHFWASGWRGIVLLPFGIPWNPFLGQRLAGTSLVSFGISWSHFWASGRPGQLWCLLGYPGLTFDFGRKRKPFSNYLGCDGIAIVFILVT